MSITAAELKEDLSKYLLLAATEEIFITQDGRVIAKLFGVLPADLTLEEAREERLDRL